MRKEYSLINKSFNLKIIKGRGPDIIALFTFVVFFVFTFSSNIYGQSCNLIVNGDFTNGNTNWSDSYPTSPITGPMSYTSGVSGRLKVNVDNDGNLEAGNVLLKNNTAFNLNSGTNYTFSVDQFQDTGTTNVNFAWVLLDNSNSIVQTIHTFFTNPGGTGTTQVANSNTNYSYSFTVGATANYQLALVWEALEDGAGRDVNIDNISLQVTGALPPTISLVSSSVNATYGDTSVDLGYTAVTNSPNQYSIDFDGTAQGEGFSDVNAASLPASPIVITVPATADAGTYNAVLKLINSTTGCESANVPITVTVDPKALTITATGQSKEFGNTLSGGTGYTDFTSSGLVNGETIGSVTVSYVDGDAASDAIGVYTNAIAISSATGGTFTPSNYSINYVAGDLTVTSDVISVSSPTVSEGDSGTTNANITVTLSSPAPTGGTTVYYTVVPGTAVAGVDYTAPAANARIIIPAGSSTGTISIPIIGDTTVEANKSFTVQVTRDLIINAGFQAGTTGWTTVSGTPNCTGSFSFEVNAETVYGGSVGTNQVLEVDCLSQGYQDFPTVIGTTYDVSFITSRRTAGGSPASVNGTVTAQNNNGGVLTNLNSTTVTRTNTTFGYTSSTFSFTATGTTSRILFTSTLTATLGLILDDLSVEPQVADATSTVTITDDDTSVAIAATDAVKVEGTSGSTSYTFTVTRSGDTSGTGSVNYAVTGSGANPAVAADFGGAFPSGTVNFAATETSKVITVNVSGDTTVESDEGFTVTLSSPVNANILTATAIGTITNDDPTITFNDITVTYGDANFNLGATSNSGGAITYSIIGAPNGTGLLGTNNQVVSIGNAGTVTIRATVAANGVYASGTKDITLTIDPKALTVSVTANSKTYDGNNDATVTLGGTPLVGIVAGDVVSIGGSPTVWDFASVDVGTGISVTATTGSYTLTGTDAGNYTVTQPSGLTADITAKALTVSVTADSKTYDGNNDATVTLGG
ncbi:Calx-beta domain-containing protein, partial [uncultured Tenacibaculum sp.]|uniref:beta strand repeat-containing protein n=1 Tax=uncultured Tenacibaculum sp. TaxID=174713 RepID=UPI0026361593